ncbi:hypothetical protein [Streptomyces sp. NPDC056549]|uniref:hypothetical protein n=1 Tax=Streptomyces sp. NPDC056549 TaxID=3345864 RepID=UPI0036CAF2AE
MESVRITWAQDGAEVRRAPVVTYSPTAAEHYKRFKEAQDGVSDVRIVPAQP